MTTVKPTRVSPRQVAANEALIDAAATLGINPDHPALQLPVPVQPQALPQTGAASSKAAMIRAQALRNANKSPDSVFGAPAPERDSRWVKKEQLCGVNFIITNAVVKMSQYDDTKEIAVLTILIDGQDDEKFVSMTSRQAVNQARQIRNGDYPFASSICIDDPSKGKYAAFILTPPYAADEALQFGDTEFQF